MKIVIDIPQEIYEMCVKYHQVDYFGTPDHVIRTAIAHGSSLQRAGRWITQWNMAHQKEYYYCSECREEYSYDGETGIKMNDYKYCPNCGSRNMEVEE